MMVSNWSSSNQSNPIHNHDHLQANADNDDLEIDLDELLDMDDDRSRRQFLTSKTSNAKKSRQEVDVFVNELLERAKTL